MPDQLSYGELRDLEFHGEKRLRRVTQTGGGRWQEPRRSVPGWLIAGSGDVNF